MEKPKGEIVFFKFLMILLYIILFCVPIIAFYYILTISFQGKINDLEVIVIAIILGVITFIYNIKIKKISSIKNHEILNEKTLFFVICSILAFTIVCLIFNIFDQYFSLNFPLMIIFYWMIMMIDLPYSETIELKSIFNYLPMIFIFILIFWGISSNRIIILLFSILSAVVLYFLIHRKSFQEDKIKNFIFLVILILVSVPLILLIAIENMEGVIIYFDTPTADQWVYIFGGIIAYVGTVFLGILAFWQNNTIRESAAKENKQLLEINNRLGNLLFDLEKSNHMPILYLQHTPCEEVDKIEFLCGNVGADCALNIRATLIVDNNEQAIEINPSTVAPLKYAPQSDSVISLIGKIFISKNDIKNALSIRLNFFDVLENQYSYIYGFKENGSKPSINFGFKE